jgi:hypothetical protein
MAQAISTTNAGINPNRRGHVRQVSDTAANDSDKTLTVPAGKLWQVEWVYASLATSADVGNRQVDLIVGDGTNALGTSSATAVQTASGTEYYHWTPRINTPNETVATQHWLVLPCSLLPPGYTIRIYDSAAVAAAADDLTIRMIVTEYEV